MYRKYIGNSLFRMFIITFAVAFLSVGAAAGQTATSESKDINTAKFIRIKRMSESWRDQPVELRLHSGKALRGLFAGAVDSQFQIRNNLEVAKVPVVDIREVVLRRQPQDLAMVGLTSAGVSALLTAGAMLGSKTTKQQQIVVAGIGAAIGFAIGWKAFYQNIVIQIE